MGRGAKRTDQPQSRAPRVKNTRRATTRLELPSWFYRVRRLRWETSFLDAKDPRDFDEDLSELEEQSQQERDVEHLEKGVKECQCDGDDSECHLGYYNLRKEREQRKREKLQERKKKEELLEFEKSKEDEVRAAYKRLRKAEKKHNTTPLKPLLYQQFDLFCCDHVNYLYDSDYFTPRYVQFWKPDEPDYDVDGPDVKKLKHAHKPGFVSGCVRLDKRVLDFFGPFRPRTQASWKPVKVKSLDRRYQLSFQFISNNYLRLRVPRKMVFDESRGAPPTTAPAFFDFAGIWLDPAKERAELERAEREKSLTEKEAAPGCVPQ
ncbi:hypothetical protein DHEL01_v212588 [Diaporthe helianthi]|uniref:Uncharacterized protein n=1 Tax=Diaporthe helianthi TaxID=158607 RepID=A0A2P5HFL0_DIAHE|nr:hypothetical protein DHEL01_v212588 [Diaporthe helianthi]